MIFHLKNSFTPSCTSLSSKLAPLSIRHYLYLLFISCLFLLYFFIYSLFLLHFFFISSFFTVYLLFLSFFIYLFMQIFPTMNNCEKSGLSNLFPLQSPKRENILNNLNDDSRPESPADSGTNGFLYSLFSINHREYALIE